MNELNVERELRNLYCDFIKLVNIKSNQEELNTAKDYFITVLPNISKVFRTNIYNVEEVRRTITHKLEIIDLLLALKDKGLTDTNNYFEQKYTQENKYNELCKDIVNKYNIKGFKREFEVNVESDKITLSLFQAIKIFITKDNINFKLENDAELSIDDMSKISEIVSLVKNVVEV